MNAGKTGNDAHDIDNDVIGNFSTSKGLRPISMHRLNHTQLIQEGGDYNSPRIANCDLAVSQAAYKAIKRTIHLQPGGFDQIRETGLSGEFNLRRFSLHCSGNRHRDHPSNRDRFLDF